MLSRHVMVLFLTHRLALGIGKQLNQEGVGNSQGHEAVATVSPGVECQVLFMELHVVGARGISWGTFYLTYMA